MTVTEVDLSTYDPTTANEDEINAAFKQRFALAVAENNCTPGTLPLNINLQLGEQHRRDWIAWYEANEVAVKRAIKAEQVEAQQKTFEEVYGVSDKAPARVVQGSAPVSRSEPSRPAMAPDTAPTPPRPSTGQPAADAGTPEDVDAAMRAVFGTSMED